MPTHRHRSRLVLMACIGFIVYASLHPFVGWHHAKDLTLVSWPRHIAAFEVMVNVFAYLPLGALLAINAHPADRSLPRLAPLAACAIATLFAWALSGTLELLQTMLPGRVSSPVDWIANTAGAACGALLVSLRPGQHLLALADRWRNTHFRVSRAADWGLLLLGLWCFAQLNPAIPFFEAGMIGETWTSGGQDAWDPLELLPHAAGIAFNVCGFALFLSLLVNPAKPLWLDIFTILALGLLTKVSMAALMLRTPQMVDWLNPGVVIGLACGLALTVPLLRIGFRWRSLVACLVIFAGGVMAKMTSVYGAVGGTLRLFDWPHGHLLNFASLTGWVHEVWPLATFLYLAALFVRVEFAVARQTDPLAPPTFSGSNPP